MVVPSLNVTVSPFGGVPLDEVIVAVNVTDCPKTDGFRLDVTVVVVGTFFTDWLNGDDVLER